MQQAIANAPSRATLMLMMCLTSAFAFAQGPGAARRRPLSAARAPAPRPVALSRTDEAESSDDAYRELAEAAAPFERQAALLRTLIRTVTPTVVHIEAVKTTTGAGYVKQTVEEAGAGVILKREQRYYVLTNRHVVRDAALDKIRIRLADGREFSPLRLTADPGADLAVLSLPRISGLAAARLGDSSQLNIGDFVVALGSPFGLSHSASFGIISAKGRRDLDLGDERVRFQNFLQTDAAINPGNSGGPLLNLRGEVVGINTAIASASGGNEGIGFSIPINMARYIAMQLIENGRVQRAYLGVKLDREYDTTVARSLGLDRSRGALISGITPNSPAERAGLRKGDVVVEFDGVTIDNDAHLVSQVSVTPIGKAVGIQVLRDRKAMRLNLKLTDRSRFEADG